MSDLIEILKMGFMKRAILGGVIVGIVAPLSGLFIVLRRMSFLGTGVAHPVLGGIALGLFLSISPSVSAIIVGIITGFLISLSTKKLKITEDSSIGIFFPFMMASGIIMLSLKEGYTPNLLSYLFGDILIIAREDILLGLITLFLTIIFMLLYYRELLLITFDEESAKALGVKVEIVDSLFLSIVALSVVVSIKIVGIILVSSLIVVPSVTALKLSKNFSMAIVLSVSLGTFSTIGGLFISYFLNLPSGAMIVVVSTALFLIVAIIKAFLNR